MMAYSWFTLPRRVSDLLQPVYGETVTYKTLLFIHGGTLLITGLLWWIFRHDPLLQTPELGQIAMWLLWDLVGGSLAHLTGPNHRYWARLPAEMRLLALASMAWQPVLLVLVFDQPVLLLVELHLVAGAVYWLLTRLPVSLVLLMAALAWALLTFQLALPAPIAVLALAYCLKAALAYRPELTVPVTAAVRAC